MFNDLPYIYWFRCICIDNLYGFNTYSLIFIQCHYIYTDYLYDFATFRLNIYKCVNTFIITLYSWFQCMFTKYLYGLNAFIIYNIQIVSIYIYTYSYLYGCYADCSYDSLCFLFSTYTHSQRSVNMAKYDQCNLELSQFYCGLTLTYTKQNSIINEPGRLCLFFS